MSYVREDRGEDDNRIRRIEDAVVKLEKDLAVMSKAITDMSESVKILADMRIETQLLKQDYEHSKRECDSAVSEIKKNVIEIQGTLIQLEKAQQKNAIAASIAGKIAWALTSASITGVVALGFYFLR
jgi:hypothetical protein